jgi:hypothetical protein
MAAVQLQAQQPGPGEVAAARRRRAQFGTHPGCHAVYARAVVEGARVAQIARPHGTRRQALRHRTQEGEVAAVQARAQHAVGTTRRCGRRRVRGTDAAMATPGVGERTARAG